MPSRESSLVLLAHQPTDCLPSHSTLYPAIADLCSCKQATFFIDAEEHCAAVLRACHNVALAWPVQSHNSTLKFQPAANSSYYMGTLDPALRAKLEVRLFFVNSATMLLASQQQSGHHKLLKTSQFRVTPGLA